MRTGQVVQEEVVLLEPEQGETKHVNPFFLLIENEMMHIENHCYLERQPRTKHEHKNKIKVLIDGP